MTNQQSIDKLLSLSLWLDKDSELYQAIVMAISALQTQEWISVDKKSHPDTPERVQVQLRNGWIITAYYEENEWFSVPYCDEPLEDRWIEAWRPLPESYKEGTNAERRTDE